MATLDTNLLLDYILMDDKDLSAEFQQILKEQQFLIPTFVLIELGYVLLKVYQLPRLQVVYSLEALLRAPWLKTNRPLMQMTLAMFETHPKLSLVDCCTMYFSRLNGALPVYTRDKKMVSQSGGMALLVP